MPTETINRYAKQSGKTVKEVEEAWEQAKTEGLKYYKDGEKNPNYWGYVNMRTRQIIGLESDKKKK